MTSVEACDLPAGCLLGRYRANGAFTDCYCTVVPAPVSLDSFVEAFYTSALFRVERTLLGWFAARPSTDQQARALAAGESSSFSAWSVEDRSDQDLLLADFTGRTKSWLMVAPVGRSGGLGQTRLFFGSAVVPRQDNESEKPGMGFVFHALLGFHKQYSRMLLRAARARVLAA